MIKQFKLKITFSISKKEINQISTKISYVYKKIKNTIKSSYFLIKKIEKKFTIIKSPHVFSKSKETFKSCNYFYSSIIKDKLENIELITLFNKIYITPNLSKSKISIINHTR